MKCRVCVDCGEKYIVCMPSGNSPKVNFHA